MSIGEMKHRITFQKVSPSINENGFESEAYENYKTLWAAVSNLSGKEFFAAKQINEENTIKFTIRYVAGLNQTMRILFLDKAYNITAIDNLKYKNKYIEIKAIEVDTDG